MSFPDLERSDMVWLKGFLYITSAVKFRISLLWLRCVMMHLSNLNLTAQLQGAAKFVVRYFVCLFVSFLLFFKTVQGLETA